MLRALLCCCKVFILLAPLTFNAQAQVVGQGQSGDLHFQVDQVTDQLSIPWGMAFISNKQMLITQRNGKIKLLNVENGKVTGVRGGPRVMAKGQGGLLDVAVPRGYRKGDWIYFTYVKDVKGKGATTLARAKLTGTQLRQFSDLLITRSATEHFKHFGSRISFDNNGHIFFSVGDRGHRPNGQDLSTHAGSLLRLNLDGSVPGDNPFTEQINALPEIWSYGHRNPQGLSFDRANKRLWAIEHGPRGGDEINLIQPGANYGWASISHGKEYWGPKQVGEGKTKTGMEQGKTIYVPSIAPASLMLYSGKAFPQWRGNLMAGALKLTHLNRVTVNQQGQHVGQERLLANLKERIRALVEGPQGLIYFSTDSGKIMRLIPAV